MIPESGSDGEGEGTDIDRILAAGLMRKLTMADIYSMTLGMWIDYIIEYNNIEYKASKRYKVNDRTGKVEHTTSRRAVQADFDRF